MSMRSTIVTAAAALTIAAGVGAVGTLPANAATRDCGINCADLFSVAFGTAAHPGFVLEVANQAGPAGSSVILARASGANPAEDFVPSHEGTVHDFIAAGLISRGMDPLYGQLEAIELWYAPKDASTGQCLGVGGGTGSIAGLGSITHVDIQPCGMNAATVWIIDPETTSTGSPFALISGKTTGDFTHPQALSVLKLGVQLFTAPLVTHLHALPLNHQQWGEDQGTLPTP
jgi:hypothetical protein